MVIVFVVGALHAALLGFVLQRVPQPRKALAPVTTIEARLIAPISPISPIATASAQRDARIEAHPHESPRAAARMSAASPTRRVSAASTIATRAPNAPNASKPAAVSPDAPPHDQHAETAHAEPPQSATSASTDASAPASAEATDAPHRVAHLDCTLAHPDYPEQSLRRAESGTAVIEIDTALDGRVVAARVAASSGYARLDAAARSAALASHCQPYAENGAARRARADVPVTFNLSE
ncbi:TonB family protein [Paraburkholderia sp.]|uniref:TonB family protein n=1 Tax=Paraburkholderia sp. TaxID=1926495 RepID=UPI00286F3561|nr:TonB family protein [Paraburkholderia sp.]